MKKSQFHHRPAVPAGSHFELPFRVDWRSGGLQGISTNDADEADAWRRDRRAEGRPVVECDTRSRKSPGSRLSMHERLARFIEDGVYFSPKESAVIAKALRARRSQRKQKSAVALPPRLLTVAHAVKVGDLVLSRCPLTSAEKALIRRFNKRV